MNLKQIIMRLSAVGYEEIQEVRKSLYSQMRDILRKKNEGIDFDVVENKKGIKKFDKQYNDAKLEPLLKKLEKEGKILPDESHYLEDIFVVQIPLINSLEKEYKKKMRELVKDEDIYIEFLDKVKGIKEILSAKLIKGLGDCSRFDNISKLWAYCGQAVVNGKSPKRTKGITIHYNPKMKSLTWVVSDCLMKSNKGYYRRVYNLDKIKQLARIYPVGELFKKYGKPYKNSDVNLSKGHIHNRALRKMRKRFLSHYWEASRELIGLPTIKTYVAGILGHNHIISWREALELEDCLKQE